MRKCSVGFRPRIHALPLVTIAPDERWAADLCRVWTGRDDCASLAQVIDCYGRELLGWHLGRSGCSRKAESALEQALIARYGFLGKAKLPFLLGSDNGLVFTSRNYMTLVKSCGLQQEFITPYSRGKTASSSVWFSRSNTNACIATDSKRCSTPAE